MIRYFQTDTGRRGVRGREKMAFQNASKWEQFREEDFQPGGVARRVDAERLTDLWLRLLLQILGLRDQMQLLR